MQAETIARRCGVTLPEYETLLCELVSAGVPSTSDNGSLFSRRMARDGSLRAVRAKAGRKGGKQTAKQKRSKRQAKSQQNPEDENDNEVEVEIESDSAFEEFWKCVPNKVGRAHAEKAYKAAVKTIIARKTTGCTDPHAFLVDRMRLFADSAIGRGDPQYIPHPSTWLNRASYYDDPKTWNRRRDPRGNYDAAQEYLSLGK
jgi:hypothetical protein